MGKNNKNGKCDCGGKFYKIRKLGKMKIFCCDSCVTSISETEV